MCLWRLRRLLAQMISKVVIITFRGFGWPPKGSQHREADDQCCIFKEENQANARLQERFRWSVPGMNKTWERGENLRVERKVMLYSESLLAGCSCCSEVQSSASVTGVEKTLRSKDGFKKDNIRLVSSQHLLGGGLSQQSTFPLMLSSHLTALHKSVHGLPAAAMCISHGRRKIGFFLFLFSELKAAAVDLFMGRIYSEGSVSHWAELRQRYQRGLNERQGINGAIW